MNLSLVILKTGEHLVGWAEELDMEPSCHLYRPHLIGGKTKVTLAPWPSYTDDEHILLNKPDILTVCEPSESVTESYNKKVELPDALKDRPKPVILNEEEQVPELTDDDYEPRYVEEPLY